MTPDPTPNLSEGERAAMDVAIPGPDAGRGLQRLAEGVWLAARDYYLREFPTDSKMEYLAQWLHDSGAERDTQAARAQAAEERMELVRLQERKRAEAAERREERLREALSIYADPRIPDDGGERARQALSATDREGADHDA